MAETSGAPGAWRPWHLLAIDLRSLALFRVALGTVLALDLVTHLPQIRDFYTDEGILPRDVLVGQVGNPWQLSVHLASGQYIIELALFLVAILFALGLLVGYRTRVCAVVSWFLVCSAQTRNPLILHGGDDLLRLLLFWGMFVPLNARFSLDRALNPTVPAEHPTYFSAGSLGLMFQLCLMYWFTAVHKWHPVWNSEGSAVYYALSLDQFATPLGTFLLQFPHLLRVLTFGTLALEFLGPILAFCPAFDGAIRLAMVPVFMGFHTALGFSLRLGNFPWVAATAWLMFLPALFWRIVERRLPAGRDEGTVIFVDAACSFGRRAAAILRSLLRLERTDVREARSDPRMDALMRDRNSWVVRDPTGALHTGYDAFVELCRRSPVTRWLAGVIASPAARRIGEAANRWVAGHRNEAGRMLDSLTPPPPREVPGLLGSGIALASLAFVIIWNFANVRAERLPVTWRKVGALTQLQQQWKLFAPFPLRDSGWYVMEGVRLDGTRFDVWRGEGAPTDARPADPSALYRNAQWRKYLGNIWERQHSGNRLYFGRYLCRRYNDGRTGAEQLNLIYIYYMVREVPPPGQPWPPTQKVPIWQHYCIEKPPGW